MLQEVRLTGGSMLAIDNLVVAYPEQSGFAIDHLGLVIDSSVSILGPSGAGKSSLLKALMNLVPARGSVFLEGVPIMRRPLTARRLLAYMPQDNALPAELRLDEYLLELAGMDGYPRDRVRPAVDQLLQLTHLEKVARHRLRWLSGGMKRRALLAGALLRRTPWILLDEPTLGLDPMEQASIRALIHNLSRHRRVILVSPFVEDAAALPDRIIILRSGRVIAETTWAVLRQIAFGHVFSGNWDDRTEKAIQLWAPESGTNRTRLFLNTRDNPNREPIPVTAEDGYLWFLYNASKDNSDVP